jgi:hypothetical protein
MLWAPLLLGCGFQLVGNWSLLSDFVFQNQLEKNIQNYPSRIGIRTNCDPTDGAKGGLKKCLP